MNCVHCEGTPCANKELAALLGISPPCLGTSASNGYVKAMFSPANGENNQNQNIFPIQVGFG